MREALERLVEEYGAEAVLWALEEALSRRVRATGRCLLTGRRLAHEKVCGYCRRCPARPQEVRA